MKLVKILSILLLTGSFIQAAYTEEIINKPEFIAATKLLYQKEFVQAISRFSSLLEGQPQSAGVHHNLACAYALNNEYDRAITEFKEAAKLEDSEFKEVALYDLAFVYLKKEMYKECSDILEGIVKDIPGMSKQDNFINFFMINKGMNENRLLIKNIIFSYDEASSELPDTAYFNPDIRPMSGRNSYFFENLEPLPLFFYKSKCASVFLGSAYWKQEDFGKGEEKFKTAVDNKEEYGALDKMPLSSAYYYLGWITLKKDDFPGAIEYLKKASELMPDYFVYPRDLAWAYFLNHDYAKAKEACETTLSLQPDNARAKEILEDARKELAR